MIAEDGGRQALQVSIQVAREGVRVAAAVTRLTTGVLTQLMRLGGAGLHQAAVSKLETGKMSVKRLQRVSGGDLHAQEVSPELLRSVKADLRRRGVSFSVENGADGKKYVIFTGRDVDTMSHAMTQAGARVEARQASRQARSARRTTGTLAAPRTKRQVLAGIQRRQRSIAGARHVVPTPRRVRSQGAR